MGDQSFRFADAETRTTALTHGVGLVIAAFVAGLGLASVGIVAVRSGGVALEPAPAEVNAVLTALQFVGFVLVGYWYLDRVADGALVYHRRPSLGDLGWIVGGLVGLFVLNVALSEVLAALDVEVATNEAIRAGREQPRLLLYLAVVSLVLTAPGEELIFRGLVQGLFRRAYGVVPAVLVTSLGFGLVHYVALAGAGSRPAYVAIAALLGLVLGALYERTETLVVPVVVHGAWNAVQFLRVYAIEVWGFDPLF